MTLLFAVSQPMATWYTYINISKELSYYKFQKYIPFNIRNRLRVTACPLFFTYDIKNVIYT